MVDGEVLAGPRDERCQASEQLLRFEHEVARAVAPFILELDANAAVVEQLETLLRDRGSSQVATEALQGVAVVRTDRDRGVERSVMRRPATAGAEAAALAREG